MASPARSDRQRLIPAWKPMDDTRPSSRSTGPSGPSPRSGGKNLMHSFCLPFSFPMSATADECN